MRRRSSGEVINATLMEVFLFLSFLVLVLLQSATVARDEAEAKRAEAEARASALENQVESAYKRLRDAEEERDVYKKRYLSTHPPDCNLNGKTAMVVDVCIGAGDRLRVRLLESVGSHVKGGSVLVSASGFRRAFDDVWKIAQVQQCRYHAIVSREASVDTSEYIAANRAVAQLFYSDWSSTTCRITQND